MNTLPERKVRGPKKGVVFGYAAKIGLIADLDHPFIKTITAIEIDALYAKVGDQLSFSTHWHLLVTDCSS